MLGDPVFWKALGNTFIYLLIQVPVMVILSLVLGVLIEQDFFKAAQRLPHQHISAQRHRSGGLCAGIQTAAEHGLRHDQPPAQSLWAVACGLAAHHLGRALFHHSGHHLALDRLQHHHHMIAGIKSIGSELYESADIDGASFLQKLTCITIPMVKPILLFVSITSTIGTLRYSMNPIS